jgi:hypothetical protein
VRLHTGALAAKSAQSINALAYNAGNDIVFGEGQYILNTLPGKTLLAHELTHVIQQNGIPAFQNGRVVIFHPDAGHSQDAGPS